MNPFQWISRWIDRRAERNYHPGNDPYIRDKVVPVRERLAEREERLLLAQGQSPLTDYMRGRPPGRRDGE